MEVTTSERYASGGELGELPAPNLVKAFYASVDRLGDDVAIRTQDDSYSISWSELRERVHRIAGGLAKLGVGKGDTVAIMLNNRPEFIPSDLAAVSLGGVPFSIYQTSSPEQIAVRLSATRRARSRSSSRCSSRQFNKAREDLPELEHVIVVDGEGGDHTLAELEEMDPDFDPASSVEELGPDDLLTLIYTSGTTGPPKGVQLTHRNLMALVGGVDGILDLPERGAKVISWLPAAHIAERGAHYYLPVIRGVTVTICPDPRKIGESLAAVRPTWFFAVPRIWEKMKAGLEAKLAALPDEAREPAQQGIAAAIQKIRLEQAGRGGPRGAGGGRRPGRGADVRAAAPAARARRGGGGERRRSADTGRGARVLPRDRDPDRRALGDVGDLRRRHLQSARTGSRSAPSARPSRASRSGSPRTAR